MRAPIRRCHADAARFAGPAKTVRLKIRIKSAQTSEELSRTWDGSVGQGANVAEFLSK